MRRDFHQYGIGFVPCTIMGWVYLFAFVIATLATVFLIRSIWAVADLPGVEIVQALVLVAGVIATGRFARLRSN